MNKERYLLGWALIILLITLPSVAAETLYRWTDASGTARYGYQPPLGIQAVPAAEVQRELMRREPPVSCPELEIEHLHLINKEISRVKAMPAGLGLDYELTPAAKRELILDLLAHRAALITGRSALDFHSSKNYEFDHLRAQYEQEKTRLLETLEDQESMLRAQRIQIERERRRAEAALHLLHRPLPVLVW
ncbi:conserved hypothetical protein [Nitrosococcus halophilus Nc 4]|uniref:DUF4124 domain-containing protein n=1 Tax=Nitrosococcus halophilus (strain Nc4) TaxID=472759 RepID=D5C4K0_NITHN|nr:DUF4124 domain-containing protein [Nitrosococcus halophilus]ADE15184.1 conserved hypothetical protein [Nitrosococcus halophilus Nc 4]